MEDARSNEPFYAVDGQLCGSRCMARCNKCHQAEPHQGDSWCLACSGVEALSEELKAGWGTPGTRVLAADLVRSCVRQVRALRRLGIAGAGRVRAASPQPAGSGRVGAVPKAPPPPPPPAPAAPASEREASRTREAGPSRDREVKKEAEHHSSDYSEGEESEDVAEDKPVEHEGDTRAPDSAGLKPAPKPRPDNREEIPRRRPEDRSGHRQGADPRRDPYREEDERYEDRASQGRRRDRSRSRHHRRHHQKGDGRGQKRKKRKHRAGSKHQRLYRAAEQPFRRFHHRQRGDFWDEVPESR